MPVKSALPKAPKAPTPSAAFSLPIDDSLFFKLVRLVNLTARPFSQTIGRANQLSLNDWRAMLVLANHPGVAASDVALLTGLDKMTVSRSIAALERRGRLVKRADLNDKRRTLLWLNAAGQRLFERIGTPAKAREAQLFSIASSAEQAQLGRSLDRLIASLLAADGEGG
jgi:DNA-binding MarR family transcriptional regulator